MAETTWAPGVGAYGILGADPGSNLGRIRQATPREGAPTKFGQHPALNVAFEDISGLGPKGSFGRRSHSPRSIKGFMRDWYEPVKQQGLIQPFSEQKGLAGIDTDKGLFEKYTSETGMGMDIIGSIPEEQRLLPAEADIGRQLGRLEETKATAYEDWEKDIAALDIEEKEEKEAFTVGEREVASQRQQAAMAAGEEYEAAEIATGATGMAYSAPAAEALGLDVSTQTMKDIATTESELRRGHRGTLTDIEGGREEAGGIWSDAQKSYETDVADLWLAADTALEDATDKLFAMMGAHKPSAFDLGGEIAGVKGMFREGIEDVPGAKLTKQRIGMAEDFALAMSNAAEARREG